MSSKLTLILLSLFLAGVALAPLRLKSAFDVAEQSSDDDTYEDTSVVPCTDDIKPTLDNIDQYDWIHCSGDLGSLWKALKIEEKTFQELSSLTEAYSLWADIDRDRHPERILRLTLRTDQDALVRFVILKYTPGKVRNRYRALAHLDITPFHLAPEARVVSGARTNWLAIANVERRWEEGNMQEDERWYELKDGRFVEVLRFPLESEADGRRVQSEVTGVSSNRGDDKVTVRITVSFNSESPQKNIEVQRKVSFSRTGSSSQFVFDPRDSDISASDIDFYLRPLPGRTR